MLGVGNVNAYFMPIITPIPIDTRRRKCHHLLSSKSKMFVFLQKWHQLKGAPSTGGFIYIQKSEMIIECNVKNANAY